MEQYITELVKDYGRMAGISIDNIGNNQIRYRHREIYGALGIWISEKRAKSFLEAARSRIQEEHLRRLEDAFGPDQLVNPLELGIPLR